MSKNANVYMLGIGKGGGNTGLHLTELPRQACSKLLQKIYMLTDLLIIQISGRMYGKGKCKHYLWLPKCGVLFIFLSGVYFTEYKVPL